MESAPKSSSSRADQNSRIFKFLIRFDSEFIQVVNCKSELKTIVNYGATTNTKNTPVRMRRGKYFLNLNVHVF